MPFYRNHTTQKSWELLIELTDQFQFTLIGGWAVWLYTEQLKSKDIDLIADFPQLEKLRQQFDLHKNERLKKYEARRGEVQIDVYAPYYSDLGIPAEEIIKLTRSIKGFTVPEIEVLLVLKQIAYEQRKRSAKGRKDLADIVSLLQSDDFVFEKYHRLLKKYSLVNLKEGLRQLLKENIEVEELNLNRHKFARLKRDWLKEL